MTRLMIRCSPLVLFAMSGISIPPSAAYAQPSQIGYQGELKKNGILFTGTANMKFVIVSNGQSLWSNDGTSVNGSQPTASLAIQVSQGIFGIRLGSAPMMPISSITIQDAVNPLLRAWVDTGTGFEQLSDQPMVSSMFSLASDKSRFLSTDSNKKLYTPIDGTLEWMTNDSAVSHAFAVSHQGTHRVLLNTNGNSFLNGGNVGIGMSSPDLKLEIAGDFGRNDGSAGLWLWSSEMADRGDGSLRIRSGGDRVIFDGGDRIGIGTTTPGTTLDVSGDIRATSGNNNGVLGGGGFIELSGGVPFIDFHAGNDAADFDTRIINSGDNTLVVANGASPNIFTIVGDRIGINQPSPNSRLDVIGNIRCTTLIQTSSRRFKNNIEPVTGALNKILALTGVSFDWCPELGGARDLGFIAEDVECILPELVVHNDDGTVAGLKYDHLTAVAVEALKEQHVVIVNQERELRLQVQRIAALEERLLRLEAINCTTASKDTNKPSKVAP